MTSKSCACGKNNNQHSLRESGRCDGIRNYGSSYYTPKTLKKDFLRKIGKKGK